MKNYHLSHTDLDGYSCQVITSMVPGNWIYLNAGYGNVKEKLEDILSKALEGDSILITDVNLKMDVADWLDQEVKERNLSLKLLDHHETGSDVAKKYDWYHLDTTICATTITFNEFASKIENRDAYHIMNRYQQIVNTYDLWKESEPNFYLGKMASQMLYRGLKFPNELSEDKSNFNIFVLTKIAVYIFKDMNVESIEGRQYHIHKEFFKGLILDSDFENPKHTLEDRLNIFVYNKFKEFDLPIITIDGIRLKLFYNVDGGVFQNVSHMFLNNNDGTFDACINVMKMGNLSIRSKEPITVNQLAVKYFNGGGHPQACGGFIGEKNSNKKYSREEIIDILKFS
jgi:oligoribonuclease NrnB/cAMP/cGMP phosphodiesterase (DHH superfamily)